MPYFLIVSNLKSRKFFKKSVQLSEESIPNLAERILLTYSLSEEIFNAIMMLDRNMKAMATPTSSILSLESYKEIY